MGVDDVDVGVVDVGVDVDVDDVDVDVPRTRKGRILRIPEGLSDQPHEPPPTPCTGGRGHALRAWRALEGPPYLTAIMNIDVSPAAPRGP